MAESIYAYFAHGKPPYYVNNLMNEAERRSLRREDVGIVRGVVDGNGAVCR